MWRYSSSWSSSRNPPHNDDCVPVSLNATLSRVELTLYVAVWSFGVFYSIYRACRSAIDYLPLLPSEDFEYGWSFLGRPKDVSDTEWAIFSSLLLSYMPWTIYHACVSNLLRRTLPNLLPYFYLLFSVLSMVYVVGALASVFLLFQITLMYVVHLIKNKWLCWAVSMLFLVLLNHPIGNVVKDFIVLPDTREEYLLAVTISWINCRCLSFCMVQCEPTGDHGDAELHGRSTNSWPDSLLHMFAYCLYFPLLFSGPLIMYDDFKRDLFHPPHTWSLHQVLYSFANVARYAFWFAFNDFILHYAYLSALHFQSHFVEHLPLWSFCGLGYGMSQFFMTKYTVLYGFPSAIAAIEGFDAPSKPKCIARIHLYSDMWKYFDRGLYTFLKRYIYVPIVNQGRSNVYKLCGGALCFIFVYVWHGTDQRILIWTVLNFLGVAIENFAIYAMSTESFKGFQERRLSHKYARHLKALLIVPLLMMSAISSFYFICGVDIGNMFVKKFLIRGWSGPVWIVAGFFYCMCHVSEEIKTWELKRCRIKPVTF